MASHCGGRGKFGRELDGLDRKIAALVAERDALMKKTPNDYDCCGEGEVYFSLIEDFGHAEAVYHAVAEID